MGLEGDARQARFVRHTLPRHASISQGQHDRKKREKKRLFCSLLSTIANLSGKAARTENTNLHPPHFHCSASQILPLREHFSGLHKQGKKCISRTIKFVIGIFGSKYFPKLGKLGKVEKYLSPNKYFPVNQKTLFTRIL